MKRRLKVYLINKSNSLKYLELQKDINQQNSYHNQ